MDSPHLLVPIRVQALVIDNDVIDRSGVVEIDHKFAADDGRWSPQVYDYKLLTASLNSPAPAPFYGARRTYQGRPAEQLVLEDGSPALPKKKDRGVYLHWVLPAGLRHAYTPGLLDFPALPDHWLIVRYARRGSALTTKAWFLDGGAVTAEAGPANLLFDGAGNYVAKRVGRVVPFEGFASANAPAERTTITALGNALTGSPTFTGFIAENRNVFSWHDKLDDLRAPDAEGDIPDGTTLTYSLIGWYRDPGNEPLAAPAAKVVEQREGGRPAGWLIDPPGWFVEAGSAAPDELLKRRSVFHGTVARINYWNRHTYKGQILGYPGAPPVPGVFRQPPPPFQVGVGNSAEDALVSLVSGSYAGEQKGPVLADEQPNLWKALEAVIYRQTDSLIKNWSSATRDMAVHQNWFATRDAGKLWFIRPHADRDPVFPKDPNKTAAQTGIEPAPDDLTRLAELNRVQSDADAVGRELAALQQDLYARWWRLCHKSRGFRADITAEEKECRAVAARVRDLQTKHNQLLGSLRPLPDELKSKLPGGLELKYDAAPRFWTPADPVVVIKNCGLPTKHQFPSRLPCRLPEQIVTSGKVVVDEVPREFGAPEGVAEIGAAARRHLPACPDILTDLLNESSIVEQALRDLAERTLPAEKDFKDARSWRRWAEQLDHDLTWDGDPDAIPFHEIDFGRPGAWDIRPHRLAELWTEQPWSPLFIDWQITWFPTAQGPAAEQPFGPAWGFAEADFGPANLESIPRTGYTVRGRSLLSPIDERIFKEPINTLRGLLHSRQGGARKDDDSTFPEIVREILSRYESVWDKTLGELSDAGLMGQALTGFHQALLRRDVTLPRITPDRTRPWVMKQTLASLESEIKELLEPPDPNGFAGDRLAPPAPIPPTPTPTIPFSMIRAGAVRIDELWLIDDFGQTADLLGLTAARSRSTGQIFHPRMRWHNDQSVFAMPPRVLQPARLNFRFTAEKEDPGHRQSDPALRPICGWVFYNPLDQALVLCDRKGQLLGHLLIVKDQRGTRIHWEAGAGGVAIGNVANPTLKRFAESLVETTPSARPRLLELLNLIDRALERIRPAAAMRDTVLMGRPLALVNASVGMELFGKAWSDPSKPAVAREGTGDETLNRLRVRVNLGYAHSTEDGLVGVFRGGAFNRIVPTQLPPRLHASDYIGDPEAEPLRVGFNVPERVTLLMDPWGSVQAACGLVPAKTISLAHADLDRVAAHMEASFRVGPVLLQADRIALPTPAGEKGSWNFYGPFTDEKAAAVVPVAPGTFSDQPVVAAEGRLALLAEE